MKLKLEFFIEPPGEGENAPCYGFVLDLGKIHWTFGVWIGSFSHYYNRGKK